jgi:hypothetical protein
MNKSKILATIYQRYQDNHFASGRGAVYSTSNICCTLLTVSGGGNMPHILIKKVVN